MSVEIFWLDARSQGEEYEKEGLDTCCLNKLFGVPRRIDKERFRTEI